MVDKYYALGFLFVIQTIFSGTSAFIFYSYYQGLKRKYVQYWSISLLALAISQLALSLQYYSTG